MRAPYKMKNPCSQCRTSSQEAERPEKCKTNQYYFCQEFQKEFINAWEAATLFLIEATGMEPSRHHSHPEEHNKEYPPKGGQS